jgi:choline dehydrogenase-like flavoprotein
MRCPAPTDERARGRHHRGRHLPHGRGSEAIALNKFNQMHDVSNVFVVVGSSFASATEKNPTLTILSLSWRATDYLADQMKQGVL